MAYLRYEDLEARVESQQKEIVKLKSNMRFARDILYNAPELNPSNYTHDQVCELNTATIEAFGILDKYSEVGS